MGLWQEKGRGWRYQFTWPGPEGRRRRVTGKYYKTKKDALAAMEAHKLALMEEGKNPGASVVGRGGITFRTLANSYLEDAERRFIRDTFAYKRLVYRRFLEYMGGDIEIDALTPLEIERFLRTRPTNTSYNRHRRELAALWAWAIARDLVTHNLISKVPKMPEDQYHRPVMGAEDWEKILNHAGQAKPLLQVMYYTLGRIDEVIRLKWDDIDFENNTIRLATRKRVGVGV